MLVLVGPSGCGKSTTLRMANRLVEPTSGRILLEGEDVTTVDPVELRRRMGYVIQNVGPLPAPHGRAERRDRAGPARLGPQADGRARRRAARPGRASTPDRYARRYPHELSGGERQRVGVARALATDPPVLLMDEPFGAVDPVGRRRLQNEFARIQRTLGTTVMLVTHDIDEAVRMADRVAVLSTGAHIEQLAAPLDIVARPGDPGGGGPRRARAHRPPARARAAWSARTSDPSVARTRADRRRRCAVGGRSWATCSTRSSARTGRLPVQDDARRGSSAAPTRGAPSCAPSTGSTERADGDGRHSDDADAAVGTLRR